LLNIWHIEAGSMSGRSVDHYGICARVVFRKVEHAFFKSVDAADQPTLAFLEVSPDDKY
jgi:hypothetical protein